MCVYVSVFFQWGEMGWIGDGGGDRKWAESFVPLFKAPVEYK